MQTVYQNFGRCSLQATKSSSQPKMLQQATKQLDICKLTLINIKKQKTSYLSYPLELLNTWFDPTHEQVEITY